MDTIEKAMEAIAPGCFSEHCSDIDRYEIERMVRAVIGSIRVPSDKMICAALDDYDNRGSLGQGYVQAWQAMIDEALKTAPLSSKSSS